MQILHVSVYSYKLQYNNNNNNNNNNRSIKEKNTAYNVSKYNLKALTVTLRRHLFNFHDKEWGSECTQLGIQRKPLGGLALTEENSQAQTSSCLVYSQERFIDALVNFIAVTDQVYFYFILFLVTNFFSL